MQKRALLPAVVVLWVAACEADVERSSSAGGQGSGQGGEPIGSVGPGGSGGTGGAAGAGGEGGAGGAGGEGAAGGGGAGAGGQGGQGDCMEACAPGLSCCAGKCVNLKNDIKNCGACGVVCESENPYCNDGFTCMKVPPCLPEQPPACDPGGFCCVETCCNPGQLCCVVEGPGPAGGASCQDPVDGTCPVGCPGCQ